MNFIVVPTIYDALHPAFGANCITYPHSSFFIGNQSEPTPCAVPFIA
jgi:hypothetical protein